MEAPMPSNSYADPRLAALYDALNPPRNSDRFYLDLAGSEPLAVLDMGCGTGWLASELARRGHRVVGADPSEAMLGVAQASAEALDPNVRPSLVVADAASFDWPWPFDLIIMTGHAFQVLREPADMRAAVANFRRHLRPGGRLAFETRNPAIREWESWTPDETRESIVLADGTAATVHNSLGSVALPLVSFETHFLLDDGDRIVTQDTLRFSDQREVAATLAEAGFESVDWIGDWDGSPFVPASKEIIAIARR
jgi:SAM-dependent methyltransferase